MDKIFFSEEDLQKCNEFSKLSDTSFYSKRNQWNSEKRKFDACIGKLGELTAYYTLIKKYPNITYPDFNIYSKNKKSWDYDLKDANFNLHVKSQEAFQASKFGQSWIFQNEDKKIFMDYNDYDFVVFVAINFPNKTGEVKKILPVNLLHTKKLFKKPLLEKLVSKSAVYFEDIKLFDNKLFSINQD